MQLIISIAFHFPLFLYSIFIESFRFFYSDVFDSLYLSFISFFFLFIFLFLFSCIFVFFFFLFFSLYLVLDWLFRTLPYEVHYVEYVIMGNHIPLNCERGLHSGAPSTFKERTEETRENRGSMKDKINK